MLTIELDHRLEASFLQVAKQEHQSPTQIINKLITQYVDNKKKTNHKAELLVNFAKNLNPIAAFSDKDPLSIQKEMRDEWH